MDRPTLPAKEDASFSEDVHVGSTEQCFLVDELWQSNPCLAKEDLQQNPCLAIEEDLQPNPCLAIEEDLQPNPCLAIEDLQQNPCLEKEEDLQKNPCLEKEEDLQQNPCLAKKEDLQLNPCLAIEEAFQLSPCFLSEEYSQPIPCFPIEEAGQLNPFSPVGEASSPRYTRRWWCINQGLLYYKIHFFLLTGAFGALSASVADIARDQVVVAPTSFLLILSLEKFSLFLIKPIVGMIADELNRLKSIILILILIQGITFLGTLAIPGIPQGVELCGSNYLNLTLPERTTTTALETICTEYSIWREVQTPSYWLFAAAYITMNVAANTVLTLSDTACIESTKSNFGRQRLWGGAGWGIFLIIGGYLNDLTNNYYMSAIIYLILSIAFLFNIRKVDMSKPQRPTSIMKDTAQVIKSKKFLIFELQVLICGIGMGVLWFHLISFITELGGSQFLCGLIHAVQCFGGELPFMYISSYLEDKLGFPVILSFVFVAYFIKYIFYSLISKPWLFLLIEWLHGLTNGLFYTAMVSNAKKRARIGIEATTQALVSATYDGLGSGLGSVLSGYGIYVLGFNDMFLGAGIFFGICAMVSFVANIYKIRKIVSSHPPAENIDVSSGADIIVTTSV